MKRTQIQLPDGLYEEIKVVAKLQDWSVTEVLRRGAEYIVGCYPSKVKEAGKWQAPAGLRLGAFKTDPEQWRELAQEL